MNAATLRLNISLKANLNAAAVAAPQFILLFGFLAACLLFQCAFCAAQDVPTGEVRYSISLSDPERHLVQIVVNIPPGEDFHELQLPVWNALYQIRDFSQNMIWIRAADPTGRPLRLDQIDKSRWMVVGSMQGAVVEYQMFSDDPGPYGAQLNPHHAFFNLAEVLIYAADLRNSPAQVEFQKVPPGLKIATALEKRSDAYVAANYDRLVDSPVEIGDFAEQDFDGACGRYRVVLDREASGGTPSQQILTAFVPQLRKIVDTASSWMNDCPFHEYLFIYHASDAPAGGGMEHSYSTAITLPAADFESPFSALLGVSSHEFFHLWNVKRIRPRGLEPVDYTKENYTDALWFSEGVDTTASQSILLQAGLLDEQHYLDHLSKEITELESRPAHLTQTVEQASLDAWLEKYPYYALPERSISYYNKGELLGVLLDLTMRSSSSNGGSLRDLFRWMNDHYAKQGKFFDGSNSIREAAETVGHLDLHTFFEKYVAGTEEIPWDRFFDWVGLRLEKEQVSVADPGFEAVQKFDRPPTVVEIYGNDARQAGLQAGDALLNVNGQGVGRDFDQVIAVLAPGEILRVTIRRDGVERTLEWKLTSRSRVEFHLRDVPGITPEQRARRAAWLFDRGPGRHP